MPIYFIYDFKLNFNCFQSSVSKYVYVACALANECHANPNKKISIALYNLFFLFLASVLVTCSHWDCNPKFYSSCFRSKGTKLGQYFNPLFFSRLQDAVFLNCLLWYIYSCWLWFQLDVCMFGFSSSLEFITLQMLTIAVKTYFSLTPDFCKMDVFTPTVFGFFFHRVGVDCI